MFEFKCSTSLFVINILGSSVCGLIKILGLVLDGDNTITTIPSFNLNSYSFLTGISLDSFALFEVDSTWLVIINNCDSCSGVFTLELLVSLAIEELNEEILIWLP